MLPTDDRLVVEPYWRVDDQLRLPGKPPPEWRNDGLRILQVTEHGSALSPPWLVNVGGINMPQCGACNAATAVKRCAADQVDLCSQCDETVHGANTVAQAHSRTYCTSIQWYAEGAQLFFDAVAGALRGRPPRHGRERHLVALPLVGTGKGGASQSTGGVLAVLMPEIYGAAERFGYDVALVMIDASKFAAVQVWRRREFPQSWSELGDALRRDADRLAHMARRGNLVLFLGSGVSAGAGLPTWRTLIETLARDAGLSGEETGTLLKMNYLDSARIIELHLSGAPLNERVARLLRVQQCSLVACLLAGLPVKEAVTTNYDEMFEIASQACGMRIAVLPYVPASDCDRWLLKLHGCVTHPRDIVLTREDYIRYATRRSALQGIVQSLLITRHMLFVGFSLQDDNFHRIVDEVRRSTSQPTDRSGAGEGRADTTPAEPLAKRAAPDAPVAARRFGTSLMLVQNRIADMLWAEYLNMVPMEMEAKPEATTHDTVAAAELEAQLMARAARRLEIFLDCVSSGATTTAPYLLKPQFDALLSDAQRKLVRGRRAGARSAVGCGGRRSRCAQRNSLVHFVRTLPVSARTTDEWQAVQDMLRAFGDGEYHTGAA